MWTSPRYARRRGGLAYIGSEGGSRSAGLGPSGPFGVGRGSLDRLVAGDGQDHRGERGYLPPRAFGAGPGGLVMDAPGETADADEGDVAGGVEDVVDGVRAVGTEHHHRAVAGRAGIDGLGQPRHVVPGVDPRAGILAGRELIVQVDEQVVGGDGDVPAPVAAVAGAVGVHGQFLFAGDADGGQDLLAGAGR